MIEMFPLEIALASNCALNHEAYARQVLSHHSGAVPDSCCIHTKGVVVSVG